MRLRMSYTNSGYISGSGKGPPREDVHPGGRAWHGMASACRSASVAHSVLSVFER